MLSNNVRKRLPQSLKTIMLNLATSYITDVRNKALQELEAFFEQKTIPNSVFEYSSLVWLWDGLASAMVRQDHPLMQEALADKITELIHLLSKHKTANKFFKAALEVIPRYWRGLPHCMLNKMMMLFRRAYRQALFRLADHNWEYVESFVAVLEETVILPLDNAGECEYNIKSFLVEIYLEELAKASNESLDAAKIMIFLKPYIKVLTVSNLTLYKGYVRGYIFNYLMRQSDLGISNRSDLLANEIIVDEAGKKVTATNLDEENSDSEQSDEQDITMSEDEEASEGEEEEDIEDEEDVDNEEEDIEEEEEEDSEENDEGTENSDEEAMEEDELDPRAGSVDVVLPQLNIDSKCLADALLKAEEACPILQEKKRLRRMALKFMDLSEGVLTIGTHPSLQTAMVDRFQEDHALNFERALARRMAVEEENKDLPVPVNGVVTKEEGRKLDDAVSRLAKLVHHDRKAKLKALSANRRLKAKRREELEFARFARRTAKMTERLERRREEAQVEKKKKKLPRKAKKEVLEERRAKKTQARARMLEASANNVDKIMKEFSASLAKPSEKVVKNESSNEKAGQKRKSTETASVVQAKKSKSSDTPTPNAIPAKNKKSKKKAASPKAVKVQNKQKSSTGIKINLKENKHQLFSDYKKSVKESPAIPYQPDKTPLRTALKATNSPILVKKGKVKRADVLKGVQNEAIKKTKDSSAVKESRSVKSIKKKTNSTSAKPLAKKLPSKRAVAADFF